MEGTQQEEFAHADFSMHATLKILKKLLMIPLPAKEIFKISRFL